MLRVYLRIALTIAGLIGAVVLFAFAFTAAAVVVLAAIAVMAIMGRPRSVIWTRAGQAPVPPRGTPLIIDHDPNDLPRREP